MEQGEEEVCIHQCMYVCTNGFLKHIKQIRFPDLPIFNGLNLCETSAFAHNTNVILCFCNISSRCGLPVCYDESCFRKKNNLVSSAF